MYYCHPCGEDRHWPTDNFLPTSIGPCEMCNYEATCYDVPSSHLAAYQLTPGQVAQNEELEAIRSIKTTIEKRSPC